LDASRIEPFERPDFFTQAVIFPLAEPVANAPNADAVTAPTTAMRHTVATALTYVIRGIDSTVTRGSPDRVKRWEGGGESLGA
jgi:hypothetical protein